MIGIVSEYIKVEHFLKGTGPHPLTTLQNNLILLVFWSRLPQYWQFSPISPPTPVDPRWKLNIESSKVDFLKSYIL